MPDRFVAVDWSAANRPVTGPDSVWVAVHDGHSTPTLANPSTRSEGMAIVREAIRSALDAGDRIVVGVDAGFGYPAGTAAALDPTAPDWSTTWALLAESIDDDDANRSNRFEVAAELNRRLGEADGPFWGGPPSATGADLGPKRSPFPFVTPSGELAEYRIVEQLLRSCGHRAQSVWKLYTTGSVGSQTLLAIAHLERLRRNPDLVDHVRIWPFETVTAADVSGPVAIVAELWPNLAATELDPVLVKDAAQVRAAVEWLAVLADADRLDPLLLLADVDPGTAAVARAEEGWILGAEHAEARS